jgi:myo-inositol 2-dehydrogenase/D-chiro-inositol 1-dehydrogenase
MIHDFDMACWLMGGTPDKVTSTGACLVDKAIGEAGDVDTAMVVLQWADGRLATIRNTRRAAYGHDQRIELMGSDGLLTSNNMQENTVTRATAEGVTAAKPVLFFLERYMRAYEAEWSAFVNAVKDGAAMPVTIQDGVNALALAEAANMSRVEGRTVTVEPAMLGQAS